MLTQFSRTELLLGKEAMDKLKNSRVAVFGIGGVGGYVCEALVRSGVGAFDLIDHCNQKDRWKIQNRCYEGENAGDQSGRGCANPQMLLPSGKCR